MTPHRSQHALVLPDGPAAANESHEDGDAAEGDEEVGEGAGDVAVRHLAVADDDGRLSAAGR